VYSFGIEVRWTRDRMISRQFEGSVGADIDLGHFGAVAVETTRIEK